ncbi:YvrJ family protein [Lactobacillus sp. Sy-1]|uniref:YvrJ family protein n=1 Tax=Lactobacillus sp. Sy-1 TaxID=2109645 RepID=UPI001C5AEC87|nr:YvrJ family protein [Lactobacillus sp. Sy-1]MBW1606445.1 YvrJ family protein [Lactobacillus sp. Sy-1]
MESEILKYVVEQSSGVIISLLLITRIEGKLDKLSNAISSMTDRFVHEITKKS